MTLQVTPKCPWLWENCIPGSSESMKYRKKYSILSVSSGPTGRRLCLILSSAEGLQGHRLLSQKLQGQLGIAVNLPRMPGSATSDWTSVSPSVKWRYLVTWHRLSSTDNQLPFNCNNGKSQSFVSWNSNLKRNQELVLHCNPQVSYKAVEPLYGQFYFSGWFCLCAQVMAGLPFSPAQLSCLSSRLELYFFPLKTTSPTSSEAGCMIPRGLIRVPLEACCGCWERGLSLLKNPRTLKAIGITFTTK